MMKKFLFFALLLCCVLNLNAQVAVNDSVTMNANYQDEVYYSFYTGAKPTATIKNWDLAFSTYTMDVGIRINSINGVNLWSVPGTDTTGWATLDTAGYQSWQELHNTDSAMFYGAFNISNTPSQFDFSWGVYDFNTHEVIGDSLFVIKVTDLQGNIYFKKLWIIKRADNANHDWIFRYSNIDNTGDTTITIPTTPYDTKNFIYYSITNGNIIDREPASVDWDIVFTRYTTDVGGGMYYPVAGTYSNYPTEVADVRPVDVATTNSDLPYLNLYTYNLTEIGHDWKTFNMSTSLWEIEDSLVYFVRTGAGEVYKLVMTGFDGAGTGNIYFNKTLVSTTGISESMAAVSQAVLYPNPSAENTQLLFTAAKDLQASLKVFGMDGKVMMNAPVYAQEGLNRIQLQTSRYPDGIYVVEINSGSEIIRQKLVIQ